MLQFQEIVTNVDDNSVRTAPSADFRTCSARAKDLLGAEALT
jgi:hypothetical protein